MTYQDTIPTAIGAVSERFPITEYGRNLVHRAEDARTSLRQIVENRGYDWKRARLIADEIDTNLLRKDDQPVLCGPYPELSALAYTMSAWKWAIANLIENQKYAETDQLGREKACV